MNTATLLDPLVSEFETLAQEDQHNAWLNNKVQTAIYDPRPSIPHDEAMARVDAKLVQLKQARTRQRG